MQHSRRDRPDNRPIAIDVGGEPLGVVVPERDEFRFVAVRLNAFVIDGQRFKSVDAAREAARWALQAGNPE
jgi:hypothetical protein